MNRYMEKAILRVGVVCVGVSLLSACNTTQDSRSYVEQSSSARSGHDQTVVVGKEISAPAVAESSVSVGQRQASERHRVEESFHAPAG